VIAMQRSLREARERVTQNARVIPKPEALLAERRQRLDLAAERLPRGPSSVVREKTQALSLVTDRLPRALSARLDRHKSALAENRASLRPGALQARIRDGRGSVAAQSRRLHAAAPRIAARKTEVLAALIRTLNSLSYLRVLDRGFAVVRNAKGKVISDAGDAKPGMPVAIEFSAQGSVNAVIEGNRVSPGKKGKLSAARKVEQKDLFNDI